MTASACLHWSIERQARRTPGAVAVVDERASITYGELERAANHLAQGIVDGGLRRDEVIAVIAGRSLEATVGALAVLKAGAAYLPCDPSLPAKRLAFLLADADARYVVTTRAAWGAIDGGGRRPIFVDDAIADPGARATSVRGAAPAPEDLAYVMYTSGSTGTPKGVEMPHEAIARLIEWQTARFVAAPDARSAQYAALVFDQAVFDLATTLGTGGALYLVPEALRADFPALCEWLRAHRIERIGLPTTALGQIALAIAGGAPLPGSLREVIVTGEPLQITPAVRTLFERLGPDCALDNQYGPTETSLGTACLLRPPVAAWPDIPPIGTPVSCSSVYLLDGERRRVPAGEIGEIFIGRTVARGYRGRPELTAERFVPDPFAGEAGARMYRTGDLAVQRSDGSLEFRGRADLQVKVRGHRIELGEVESALARHPAIRQAVAVPFVDGAGQQALRAYVVRATAEPAAALRRYLAAWLPAHAVPASIVAVDALPMTPTGKIDREALGAIEPAAQELDTTYVAPRGPVEAVIARSLAGLLAVERVGVRDNFFERGVHSLLAVSLVTDVGEILGVELSPLALLDHPTIAELVGGAGELSSEAAARRARAYLDGLGAEGGGA